MITNEKLLAMFKEDREGTREYLKTMKAQIKLLEQLKDETGRPDWTIEAWIKEIGFCNAADVMSTLMRRHGWDGRIDPRNVDAFQYGGLDRDAAVDQGVYTRMHMAHLDQIATAFRRLSPERIAELDAMRDDPAEPEQPAAEPEQPAAEPEQPAEAQEQPAEAQEQPAARRTGCGYYNEKVLTKFRDALQQARADYAADPDRYNVTISNANSKMGAVASVSLLPFLTCPGCCRTTCGAKCYAAKLANLRPAVLRSYAMNTAIWMADPEKFFRQVRAAIMGVRFFRFHVSGDIPGADYFRRMLAAAAENSHCQILCFTKAFSIVNSAIAAGAVIPANLHLLFSGWSNLDPENPYGLPETNVIERGAEPAEGWKICGGNCFNCACRGVGCWQAVAGDVIAFPIH